MNGSNAGGALRYLTWSLLAGLAAPAPAAVVTFTGMPSAVYGPANEADCSGPLGGCWIEDGVAVGKVDDPTDLGAHLHRAGLSSDRELQYHPDSSGLYVRRVDGTRFSLESFTYRPVGEEGGDFVLYAYASAVNDPLLGNDAETADDAGLVAPVATLRFANAFSNADITLRPRDVDPLFGDIAAFWIHLEGYPHSPTTNYPDASAPPDFDLRIDDITLAAASPVPLPGTLGLLAAGLVSLARRRRAGTRNA
jgi:hypothetical protein